MLDFLASYRQGQYPLRVPHFAYPCFFRVLVLACVGNWSKGVDGLSKRNVFKKYSIVARAMSNSQMILGDERIPVLASGHTSCAEWIQM